MRPLATLVVVLGILMALVPSGALALGGAVSAGSEVSTEVNVALQTPASLDFAKRACRRRAALKIRDFVKEQLSPLPRPIGYLVSSVGVTRWLQSLKLVPAMVPTNAAMIQARAPYLGGLLKRYGKGDVADGLAALVEAVGAPKATVTDESLLAYLDLGGEQAKLAVDVCVNNYRLTTTPLQRSACDAYTSAGEAGLKLLAIKLFTNTVRNSPVGEFAVQFGGFHGLASRDPKLVARLGSVVAKTRIGTIMSRVGGFPRILSDLQQGSHGLESIAWSLFGPKLWEKAAHCAGGDGAQYAAPRPSWPALARLARDTTYIPSFPASAHYTYQFWVKPSATFASAGGNIFRHGSSSSVSAPAVSACAHTGATAAPGLSIQVDGANGPHGIACTSPLPVDECTFVTVVNRNGDLRVYYNDVLVNKVIVPGARTVEGPVYFSDPWSAAAAAEVMPVSVLARAVTAHEISRAVGATHNVCRAFAEPLRKRFSAVREAEAVALSEIASEVHVTVGADVEADSKTDSASSSRDGSAVDVTHAQTAEQTAELNAAQHAACQARIRSLSARKLAAALASSSVSDVFAAHSAGGSLRSFLEAGARGSYDAIEIDSKLISSNATIGAALAHVGGLRALVAAAKGKSLLSDADAWSKVQDVIITMGGGKVELALERCASRSDVSNIVAPLTVDQQVCEVALRWGRGALPGYAVKLFEQALLASRAGHLVKHYGSINVFAAAMRSNPVLEGKVALLFSSSEAGKLTTPHGGLSGAITAILHGADAFNNFVWASFSGKITAAANKCPAASPKDAARAVCRQRVVRRATHEFLSALPKTPLATTLTSFVPANTAADGSVLTSLLAVPPARLYLVDAQVQSTPWGRSIAPLGGVTALSEAARLSHASLMNFVWKLNKLQLIPEVDRCVKRSARQAEFVDKCRLRVQNFYLERFNDEVALSPLAPFAAKFGGFAGLARHDSQHLERLSKLAAQHSIAARFAPIGGLGLVFATVKQDPAAFGPLLTDMYGATAQAALSHCDEQAANAADASTKSFMVALKAKMGNPAFKRILDRALLAASNPTSQSALAHEIARLGGLNGLALAAADGKDSDLEAFVRERIGSPLSQAAVGPFLRKVGLAKGLLALSKAGKLATAAAQLQCDIINSSWLKRATEELGGCTRLVPLTGKLTELTELSQAKVNKMFIDTGLSLVFGQKRALEQALLTGQIDEVLRNSIVATFAAEHGASHAAQLAEMFTKILSKMEAHVPPVAGTPKSFLEAGSSARSEDDDEDDEFKKKEEADGPATGPGAEILNSVIRGLAEYNKPGEVVAVDVGNRELDLTSAHLPDADVEEMMEKKKAFKDLADSLPVEAEMKPIAVRPEKVINDVPARCPNQCSSRGKCVQNTGKSLLAPSGTSFIHPYECICDPGWTGTGCEVQIDQYVRWLLSKGRYEMPKCCPTCTSQTDAMPEGRWIPAASANPFPVSPHCAHPEWISDRQKRADCIRSVLATRKRVVPSPDVRVVSFLETGASVTVSDAPVPTVPAHTKTLFDNYAARTNADLNAVEAAFDAQFGEQLRNHRDAAMAESSMNQALLESTAAQSADAPLPGSAAAMFPEKTPEQLRAEHEARYTSAFTNAYSLVEDAPVQTGTAGATEIGTLSEEAPAKTVKTDALMHDTSALFTPTPLDEIYVPDCCIPCDAHPYKPPEPKYVPPPQREKGILQRLAEDPLGARTRSPHEPTVAGKLITGKDEDGMTYRRRGPITRINSWAERVKRSTHERRSNSPLPSEIKVKSDDESCCSICPFKHVRGIFDRQADTEESTTPASFLERDAKFVAQSEETLLSFIEQDLSVVLRRPAADADVDFALENEYDLDADALTASEPSLMSELETILGSSKRLPEFPSLEDDSSVAAHVARRASARRPMMASLMEVSSTATSTAKAAESVAVAREPFPADPNALTTEQEAELLVQRHKLMKAINATDPCNNESAQIADDLSTIPRSNSTKARLSRMDLWIRTETTNSTLSAQAALSNWLSKLERRRRQTKPPRPSLDEVDLSTNVGDITVPFVPRPDKKPAPCCNICPSVFVLRQFPHNPWEEGPGPAFEVLN